MEGTTLDEAYNMSPMHTYMPINNDMPSQSKREISTAAGTRKSTPLVTLRQVQEHYSDNEQHVAQPTQQHQSQKQPSFQQQPIVVQQMQPMPQQMPQQSLQQYNEAPKPSYFDAMVQKRRDVLKYVSFAVVILLAISIHTVVDFGLKEFIMSNDFTFKQEIGLRLLYPVAVVFLLWNMRALGSSTTR